MAEAISADDTIQRLCLRCGICCNGVLFRDVELQAGDDPARLRSLGVTLQKSGNEPGPGRKVGNASPVSQLLRLPQPCEALGEDCRCRIYLHRPRRCRAFECALFKEVQAGRRAISDAQRVIRTALEMAERVKTLLRQLGDTEETLALSLRFQRMQRAMNSKALTHESAGLYAELTLAVHDLNLLLGREFHP